MRGFRPALLFLVCGIAAFPAHGQGGGPSAPTASLPPMGDCSTGPYIVFFDWGRAKVTADARPILDNAISALLECLRGGAVTVDGHADRSGPAARNLSLSRRRAATVAAYLARHGVGRRSITMRAFGESRPLVETEDGVQHEMSIVFPELSLAIPVQSNHPSM